MKRLILNGTTNCQLQVASSNVFDDVVYETFTYKQSECNFQNLSQNTVYYWRVRALIGLDTSNWSATYKFTTQEVKNVYEDNSQLPYYLYPIPADDNIILSDERYFGKTFIIYDISGAIVTKDILLSSVLRISRLNSGTYFIKIGNELLYFVKN